MYLSIAANYERLNKLAKRSLRPGGLTPKPPRSRRITATLKTPRVPVPRIPRNGRVTKKDKHAHFRAILALIFRDLAGTEISETKRQLCHRFAALCVGAEEVEAQLVAGKKINLAKHAQLCSTMHRLASRIGIGVGTRTETPDLTSYLTDRPADQSDPAGEDEQ